MQGCKRLDATVYFLGNNWEALAGKFPSASMPDHSQNSHCPEISADPQRSIWPYQTKQTGYHWSSRTVPQFCAKKSEISPKPCYYIGILSSVFAAASLFFPLKCTVPNQTQRAVIFLDHFTSLQIWVWASSEDNHKIPIDTNRSRLKPCNTSIMRFLPFNCKVRISPPNSVNFIANVLGFTVLAGQITKVCVGLNIYFIACRSLFASSSERIFLKK